MPKKLRSGLTYANVMATIAVFVALGGGAYAAIKLPANSVGAKQIKKNAVTGAKIRPGSLTGRNFKGGHIPAGPAGAQGIQGKQGPPGPLADELPSGRTVRGMFVGSGNVPSAAYGRYASVSFGFRLHTAPTAHVLANSDSPTPECPGSAVDPEAAPGNFCAYWGTLGTGDMSVEDAIGVTGSSRDGEILRQDSTAAGYDFFRGTWAVTAP